MNTLIRALRTEKLLMRPIALLSALALSAVAVVGCASGPPPALISQLSGTDTSIGQAEQSGAAQSALPDLQKAKQKRAEAQVAFDDKKWDAAMQLAQQAQVDAQYAARKSQAVQTQKSAAEVDRGTEALRDETERKAKPGSTN